MPSKIIGDRDVNAIACNEKSSEMTATAMAKHAIKSIGDGNGDDGACNEKSSEIVTEVATEMAEHAMKNHQRQRQKWRSTR